MKIVVTGATGFVGRPLVRRLLASGHQVTAWTRNPDSARQSLPALCDVERWDPHARTDPEKLRGADAVVHLAGESVAGGRWTAERKREIQESRVASSRSLVDAIAALPAADRPRALVAASAIGFYGDRGDALVDESSDSGSGFDAEVVREWEKAAREVEGAGVRLVIVRTGHVLDPSGGLLGQLLPPFKLGAGGPIAGGDQYMSWIHIEDEVGILLWALESEKVSGIVNLTAPNPVTNREFSKAIGRALHRPALVPVPGFALSLMFGSEFAQVLKGGQRVMPRRALDLGYEFRHPDLDEALADLL